MRRRLETDYADYELDDRDEPRTTGAEVIAFVVRAAWRHRALTLSAFVLFFGAAVGYYLVRHPMYRVEVKLLAERQRSVAAIDRPTSDDTPTRTAADLVHHRQNLLNVAKQARLLPARSQPQPVKHRGWLRHAAAVFTGEHVDDEDDPVAAVINRLDHSLKVTVVEPTITIDLDWPDPQQAYKIIEAVQQNFLESRHVQEITALDEMIALLQARTAAARRELDLASESARRSAAATLPREAPVPTPAVPASVTESDELIRLKSMLDAKERAVHDVEEFRRRRLAELQAQLDERRAVYADSYPGVVTLREDIAALSRESPQIVALRDELQRLRTEYSARLAATRGRRAALTYVQPTVARVTPPSADDTEAVKDARFKYQQLSERLSAAQITLDSARAAFKYRYNVIWPAEVPREPFSPNPRKILGGGLVASLLLALAAAAVVDLARGRIVHRSQIERKLAIPVIAELHD